MTQMLVENKAGIMYKISHSFFFRKVNSMWDGVVIHKDCNRYFTVVV